jgi:hypothetical protein
MFGLSTAKESVHRPQSAIGLSPRDLARTQSFELTAAFAANPPISRLLCAGEFTLGRSPRCDVILPELDVEVLAQLRLSPEGTLTVLPFVSDLFLGSASLMVGSSVRFDGAEGLQRGSLRLTVKAIPIALGAGQDDACEIRTAFERTLGSRLARSLRLPMAPAMLAGAAALVALLALQLDKSTGMPLQPGQSSGASNVQAVDAVRNLQLALASANIVSPVEVRLDGSHVVLSGEVTEAESDRIAEIIATSRVPVPVAVQVTTPFANGRSHVAAMALSPTQLVVDKMGKAFRPGEAFHSWTIESLEPDGLRLRRGDRIEIVSVPGRS